MKNQLRTIDVEGLRIQIGWFVELDNPHELRALADAALRYTRRPEWVAQEGPVSELERIAREIVGRAAHYVVGPELFAREGPVGGEEETKQVLAAIEAREHIGDEYNSMHPLEKADVPANYAAGVVAYERLTGRPVGDDAYVVSGTIRDPKPDESDWSMIVVPTSTLRGIILEGRKYWEDWDRDPPPIPPRKEPERAAPPADKDGPGEPYEPHEGDRLFFAELEPIAESFEAADASGVAIPGYVRAMDLGQMEPTILDPKLLGLGDQLRAWGYPACGRFHDAATALDAYYRSDERRRIVGPGPVPPIVGGPVSIDLFRLGQKAPANTTLHAHVARAERLLKAAPPQDGVEEGEEMVREDGVWTTIVWRKEDGRTRAIVRIT